MTLNLDDYRALHDDLGADAAGVLRASWQDAARAFSAQGLERYLRGAQALHALGRGAEPVASFIQEAPAVAREIGEDAVADLVQAALGMASKTSGSVIALVIATSPTAAKRLGEPGLFRGYLQFLAQLLAQAPRGVRPMLERLDRLLAQLTLGGLRRWALWGAQAHRTDYAAQERYFALASAEALAMLQQERKGTLFVDVQRRLGMYLRALWGRDFWLRPTSGDFESRAGYLPFIENFTIHLPDALDDLDGAAGRIAGAELYRATAAHAAAHLVYMREPHSAEALSPLHIAAIGLVEDARVEALAIRDLPGLAPLWRRMHEATPARGARLGDFLDRIARALVDPAYVDPHPVVAAACSLWDAGAAGIGTNRFSWEVGLALAHELAGLGLAYSPREDVPSAPYRDDNRYVWAFDEATAFGAAAPWEDRQVRRRVSLMEFVNETDVETAGDDAQEVWTLATELFPYEDHGKSYNEMEGKPPVADPVHYAEWDYQIQTERPDWCTVLEKHVAPRDADLVDGIIAAHKPLVARLRRLVEALQPQGVQRLRRQIDADEIDLEAAVRAMVSLRLGADPDPRVCIRTVRRHRDLAVLLLLDLSESTNDKVRASDATVLDLARQATALLADALAKIGDPFAIHGFASDGRHDVGYYRFKDFDEAYGDAAKGRLAAMTGQLSTRMGAAVRHAGAFLRRAPQAKKLLLVLTDGAPADVDVRDPQYLRHDARKAVEELARTGIGTFCISLDPEADEYVARIFGGNRYAVVDRIERLPERLPLLYVGLTR
jgi:Mg-chelatase subunit ChlD